MSAVVIQMTEFFLIILSLGVGGFSFLARTEETGAGFMRLAMSVALGASALAAVVHAMSTGWNDFVFGFESLSVIIYALVYKLHQDKKSTGMWILFFLHVLSLLLALFYFSNQKLVGTLYSYASMGLLGSITYAMVLGHWYLVTPKLSELPLKRSLYFIWFFLIVKIVWTSIEMSNNMSFFMSGTDLGGGYIFNWIMLTMRIGWGYLVIGVMSYFGWRLVCMRSIQSATGIFYAMTFFIFIGEIISSYLFFQYGLCL